MSDPLNLEEILRAQRESGESGTLLPDLALLKARETAISYIRFSGQKSTGQVVTHLRKKEVPDDLILQLIEDLKRDEWIDDYALAKRVLESRRGVKSEGESALRARLRRRGIPMPVIDEVLDAEMRPEKEAVREFFHERCGRELKRLKSPGLDPADYRTIYLRILRRASSRGFSQGESIAVLQDEGISLPTHYGDF